MRCVLLKMPTLPNHSTAEVATRLFDHFVSHLIDCTLHPTVTQKQLIVF